MKISNKPCINVGNLALIYLFYLGTPKNKSSIETIVDAACKDAKIYEKCKIVSSLDYTAYNWVVLAFCINIRKNGCFLKWVKLIIVFWLII